MLGPWETVWACVLLTLLVMGLDAWQATRLGKRSSEQMLARQARQKSMQFKQMEELTQ
jgi:heme exporter protein D